MSDGPEPVAMLHRRGERVVLYDEEEWCTVGQGDVYCSEHVDVAHNDVAAERCDHPAAVDDGGYATVPAFDGDDLPEPVVPTYE